MVAGMTNSALLLLLDCNQKDQCEDLGEITHEYIYVIVDLSEGYVF